MNNPPKIINKQTDTGCGIIQETGKTDSGGACGKKDTPGNTWIRVHFAEKWYPVAGDTVDVQKKEGLSRLALHAVSLSIIHIFFIRNILKNRNILSSLNMKTIIN